MISDLNGFFLAEVGPPNYSYAAFVGRLSDLCHLDWKIWCYD